ncbi:serine hydrolase [Carnobacterium sp. ISL-102]|uniref:serine hydrolase n=1 Tax=Carnobacterium sp. ISL-102 TaxID=2819142 RepID=UPI001BEA2DF6|nr:serine hydrolase [Carnobacterium sp. ISL-102]MBT2731110.1 serine hydrolase [Carnobacterium sp. ISL-102]
MRYKPKWTLTGVVIVKQRKRRRRLKKKVKIVLAIIGVFILTLVWITTANKEEEEEMKTNTATEEVETESEKGTDVEVTEKEEEVEKTDETTEAGQALMDKTLEMNASYPGNIGLVLLNKATDEKIEVNADTVFTSASLYKLYVTYAVLTEVDKGNLSLDTTINDQTMATIDDYLRETITVSSNQTAIALANRLGWDVIEKFAQENGFTETTFNTSNENGVILRGTLQTTPSNVADLLNRLMDGTLLSKTSSDYFMGLLVDQQLVYALNTGLSDEVSFAHKTGVLDSVSHDAGIITDSDGQDYIVVVMSDGWTYAYDEATPFFIEMGQSIMDYLSAQ